MRIVGMARMAMPRLGGTGSPAVISSSLHAEQFIRARPERE
jgi:hypothetical protein